MLCTLSLFHRRLSVYCLLALGHCFLLRRHFLLCGVCLPLFCLLRRHFLHVVRYLQALDDRREAVLDQDVEPEVLRVGRKIAVITAMYCM